MPENILLVFEGETTEPNILKNMKKHFFREGGVELHSVTFGAETYQLCKELYKDQDLDLIDLIEEKDLPGCEFIEDIDFSEIHLFFDHDAHSHPELSIDEFNTSIMRLKKGCFILLSHGRGFN